MNNQEQVLTKKQRRELKRQAKIENRKKEDLKKIVSKIIVWTIILIVVIGGIYWISQLGGGTSSPTTVNNINDADNTKGNLDGRIVMIEYSDFQCPACFIYYNMVKQLMEEYSEDIYFVYRNFPLRNIHSNAQLAAQAAEAAGMQYKFWEMYDKLFENQSSWSKESEPKSIFISYAEELELNINQFTTDLNSEEVKDKVSNDYASGVSARVNSTPSFFINGEKINNPRTLDDFKKIIQEILDENVDSSTEE